MASTPPASPPDRPRRRLQVNPPVFYTSVALVFAFVLFAVLQPELAGRWFHAAQDWIVERAGWFYVLAVAGFLVFVVALALSGHGRTKLGPDHSEPDYSFRSWFAMLFAAGMGIGLMFFGVAEPVMHLTDPPVGDPGTVDAARRAMQITLFHWGAHAWAIYAVVGLALAYFAYRHDLPLSIRSAFHPLIGERIHGPIGHAADIFAVLGTVFGVATSLGFGAIQVNAGFGYLFGMPTGIAVQVMLIAGITGVATVSVALGLDAGIRRLSELNLVLAVLLLVFVLAVGPTVFLLQTLVQNTGMYLSNLFAMTFNLFAYEPTGWIGGWTLFYWGWWIAWSPFVGMFIARISRGRTIREFVAGVLLVPLGFTFVWMTFFGDTAIHMILARGIGELADAVAADSSVALFQFFEYLPLSSLASLIATLLVITFFVTSADSGALVIDMLTSGSADGSAPWQRVFWAVTCGAVAAALLLAGGLDALQTAVIASALPFAVVMLVMCWGLLRALNQEAAKRHSLRTRVAPRHAAPGQGWQLRLRQLLQAPRRQEVLDYIAGTVAPALDSVVAELQGQGVQAQAALEDGAARLDVLHGEEIDFHYAVRPRAIEPPAFVLGDTTAPRSEARRYYRAEVHLREGGQDYDVMGWRREEILHDVLDQYQRHLHFLGQVR